MSRPQDPELPPDNQPGHHPPKEQDKPDLDKFAAKIGAKASAPNATNARKPPRPKAPVTKATGTTETKVATNAATKPAAAQAGPTKSAPATPDGPGRVDGSDTDGQAMADGPEPMLVSLAMLPLRETVRRLERLERALTERAMAKAGRGPRGR